LLIGDPTKAKKVLGWKPEVSFEGLVKLMVDADLEAIGEKPISERSRSSDPDIATVRSQLARSMS
ncbi:MAG: GDP-mannose 4,6-dehydratase, partial [Cyanobacteria bacterium J06649_4]